MVVRYNKLWKLLMDKSMSKTQLIKEAKISTNAIAKLGSNGSICVDVLVLTFSVFKHAITDII